MRSAESHQAAAAIYEAIGRGGDQAHALVGVSNALLNAGQIEEGRRGGRAQDIAREVGDAAEASAAGNVASADLVIGHIDEAEVAIRRVIDLFRSMGDDRGVAIGLGNLGDIATIRGKYPESVATHGSGWRPRRSPETPASMGGSWVASARHWAASASGRREVRSWCGRWPSSTPHWRSARCWSQWPARRHSLPLPATTRVPLRPGCLPHRFQRRLEFRSRNGWWMPQPTWPSAGACRRCRTVCHPTRSRSRRRSRGSPIGFESRAVTSRFHAPNMEAIGYRQFINRDLPIQDRGCTSKALYRAAAKRRTPSGAAGSADSVRIDAGLQRLAPWPRKRAH